MTSRAAQRRATLLALGDAAVDLFESEGPQVSAERIAQRAGMSRRTLHRWVGAKEELAFVHPLIWQDIFLGSLRSQEPDVNTLDASERLRLAATAIAQHVDADPDPPRRAFLVAATHPELLGGFHSVYHQWIDTLAQEIERAGVDSFGARVIAASIMGMVDAATRSWLIGQHQTFENALADGFEYIAALLSEVDHSGTRR